VSVVEERRCPNCHALVSADAEWCGQCFTSLRPKIDTPPEAPPPASPVRVTADPSAAKAGTAMWTCPVCGEENGLDLDACAVCGTSFGALFKQDERPAVDPRYALTRSLIFPGLGHRAVGRGADGLARAVLFVYTFCTALLILISGPSSGPAVGLLALYGSLAVGLYVLTAVEAYQMAQGGGPIVSSRVLLWGVVTLVVLSVLMAAFTIFAAAKS
jgi:ribosomal protein L40E